MVKSREHHPCFVPQCTGLLLTPFYSTALLASRGQRLAALTSVMPSMPLHAPHLAQYGAMRRFHTAGIQPNPLAPLIGSTSPRIKLPTTTDAPNAAVRLLFVIATPTRLTAPTLFTHLKVIPW